MNENGLSKETKIATQWMEREEVYSKLPRLCPEKVRRNDKGKILGVKWELKSVYSSKAEVKEFQEKNYEQLWGNKM